MSLEPSTDATRARLGEAQRNVAELRVTKLQPADAVTDDLLDDIEAEVSDLLERHFPTRMGTDAHRALLAAASEFVVAEISRRIDVDWTLRYGAALQAQLKRELEAAALVAWPRLRPTVEQEWAGGPDRSFTREERIEDVLRERLRELLILSATVTILEVAFAAGEPEDAFRCILTADEHLACRRADGSMDVEARDRIIDAHLARALEEAAAMRRQLLAVRREAWRG